MKSFAAALSIRATPERIWSIFTLTPRPSGSVDVSMHETFTGLVVPLISRTLPDRQPAFDGFAAALKHEAAR